MPEYIIVYIFLVIGAVLSYFKKALTASAAVVAAATGFFVYAGAGLTGLLMLFTFFISGTLATKHQWKRKETLALTEKRKGARNTMQVIANGGVAAVLGAMILLLPVYKNIFMLMMAASLASATADTLSSELGNVYGKKYFNIYTLKKDKRGLDGVISIEGSIAGIAGSMLICIVFAAGYRWQPITILIIFIAGIAGNLFDSLLGATLQRKGYFNNDVVNLLNTLFAALVALLLYQLL